jgi:putative SOS response-associated peptidase YedK
MATGKQPFCFEINGGELFAFAGLWDGWKNAEGAWVKTCSILTTIPNAVTATIHDRMPVILDRENYDLWLDPGMQNVAAISELLKPYDARLMRAYPISTRINHVANDDEDCSRHAEPMQDQNSLFS